MIVIFAEKPSQARDYAEFLGVKDKKDGYFFGKWNDNEVAITNARGHLIALNEPAEQNPAWAGTWTQEQLPMIPEKFKYHVIEEKKREYDIVRKLFLQADLIINATDAGREGELIFRYCYYYSGSKAPFQRLWASEATEEILRKAFASLKDGKEYDNKYLEARARNEADWLVGMNASRAISLKARQTYSLGRVQTPTLALVCERYLQYQNFKPQDYWILGIKFNFKENSFLRAIYQKSFHEKENADQTLAKIAPSTVCKKKEAKEVKERPPLMFSLGDLQKYCNKKLSLSLSQTLDIAQSLYEKKLTSYPRTDSSYISEALFAEVPERLESLKNGSYAHLINLLPEMLYKHSVDDSKVTDHYAIVPTGLSDTAVELTNLEKEVYGIIVERFLQALMPFCIKEQTHFVFENAGMEFLAKGTVIKEMGYRLLKKGKEEEQEEEDGEDTIPAIEEGEVFEDTKGFLEKKTTKPLPIHTAASLLSAMQTCSNSVEDKQVSKALKAGIGTSATRDGIVELLLTKGYVELKNKKEYHPTAKGLNLYYAVCEMQISKPELTGTWEMKLQAIGEGEYTYHDFMKEIKEFLIESLKEIKEAQIQALEKTKVYFCPKCKEQGRQGIVFEGKNAYYCQHIEDKSCDFAFAKIIKEGIITLENAKKLLSEGKTDLIKNFVFQKETGENFSANRYIVLEGSKLKFETPPTQQVNVACPKCKQESLLDKEKLITCSDNTCNFTLFKKFFDVSIPQKAILTILKGEKATVKGFKSKEGKSYEAILFLDEQFKVKKESAQTQTKTGK